MPSPARLVVASAACIAAAALAGCGGEVSCDNLCQHTLACEVTFRPNDDLDGKRIESGERTDLEDCALGCQENPAVTVDSAHCVDDVTRASTDPAVCQPQVLDCFGTSVPTST